MAAMDLQRRLELGEGSWGREEAKLLERFDAERKEWESQLRDMQRNIEELYNEVKARREGNTGPDDRSQDNVSANIETSAPSDPPNNHSNGHSDPAYHHSNGVNGPPDRHGNTGSITQPDHCNNNGYDPVSYRGNGYGYPINHQSNGYRHPADLYNRSGRDSVEVELEDILHSCLGQKHVPSSFGQSSSIMPNNERPTCSNERGRNTNTVDSALKNVTRVSEDLRSFQDAARKPSWDKRKEAEGVWFEKVENMKNKQPDVGNQWHDPCQALSEQSSPMNRKTVSRSPNKGSVAIPPHSTSWYLNTSPEPQLPVQESFTNRKCYSPCVLTDRKCISPSVLRKFGAMLQENEGKTFTDTGVFTNIVPADFKCNTPSFHSKSGSTKSSTFVPVQKCPSEVRTSAAEIDYVPECTSAHSPKVPRGQNHPVDRDPVGKSIPLRGSPKWSPNVAHRGIGRGSEERFSQKGVSSRPMGMALGSSEAGKAWFQAGSEKAFRPADPAAPAQTPDFGLQHKSSQNGSGPHEDLIELLSMLGIEHQYVSTQTPPMPPCPQATPQESQNSSVSMKKSFSRPACPANRRPPSRWANRTPSVPISHGTPSPEPAHKLTLCPYPYQTETVIM
ncbi:hypothetical protein AAFF_G00109810 [Aldrovandia affinis]|uniref:SOGA 1/2-like coiled-coil domain-containing protein n=1 Tax=Aldrovandia affinis TaxID=143900 RepID=A0AAD7RTU7_9TELE|nr:hypothetical protein AAFF_G00109810 [Aldrovandia affinis]